MSRKSVGKDIERPDAREKVTGKAEYTEDIAAEYDDILHMRVKRAPHPHAYLHSIDVSSAREVPGVVEVFTAEDFPGLNNFGLIIKDQPVLISPGEKMRYLGDALALVVAENDRAALRGRDKIEIELEKLPVVDGIEAALAEDAHRVHDEDYIEITHYIDPDLCCDNILCDHHVERGDVKEGFAEADLIVEGEYRTQFLDQVPLQVEKGIAEYDSKSEVITIQAASQWLHDTQADVAQAMGLEKDQIRIKQPEIGGAFGKKEDVSVHIHLALAAKELERPVQLIYNREESFLAQSKRHAMIIRHKTGVSEDGRLLAWQSEVFGDTGAYASSGPAVLQKCIYHCSGPYQVPNLKGVSHAVYTNNPYGGAMRGFGATQMGYAYENHMDKIASELNMDPAGLRHQNAYRSGSLTPNGQELTASVNAAETIEEACQLAREGKSEVEDEGPLLPAIEDGSAKSSTESEKDLLRGRGIGTIMFGFGYGEGFPDHSIAEIELTEDKTVKIRTAAADVGQGIRTVVTQIASEMLKLDPDWIEIIPGDTHISQNAGSSSATRQTYFTGNAVKNAAEDLLGNIYYYASREFGTNHPEMGTAGGRVFSHVNEDDEMSIWELKSMVEKTGEELKGRGTFFPRTYRPDDITGQAEKVYVDYTFHTQIVDVAVDVRTGVITVEKVYSAMDVGKAINPAAVEGQIEGGTAQGIGMALTEEVVVEEGVIQNPDLSRYLVPTAVDCADVDIALIENEDADGPFGAKGVGEPATIATAPAIVNAVYDATGIRFEKLPLKPERLKRELNKGF